MKQEDIVDNYPQNYAECRAVMGHRWDRVGPVRAGKHRGSWRVHCACDRCTSIRITVINAKGQVTSRRYKQPKNYRLTRDVQRTTLRLAVLTGWRRG